MERLIVVTLFLALMGGCAKNSKLTSKKEIIGLKPALSKSQIKDIAYETTHIY